ncbi:MAG: TonB-dependent receptor, partial [Chitinophagaceae bacterium]|nr:TonB-dependent receptor [Chitinophagaceae bacterium]
GIPIRTTGLFNHNALLEMNMAALKTVEVIKGPSSSLYGSEAIGGVVNFISMAPTVIPVFKLGVQGNDIGYKRAEFLTSVRHKKFGFVVSGYHANKKNGYLEYSDFKKSILTARADYQFNNSTSLSNSVTILKYDSDMSGGIDSTMFANRSFKNLHSFTYRRVDATRFHSTLSKKWSDHSKITITGLLKKNSIAQNPAYRVKDDYRKQGNVSVGKKDLAHGEINESSFQSYSLIAQHKQQFDWLDASITGGASVDLSPSDYQSNYIRIKKDSTTRKYLSYESTDSVLTNYSTGLNNYAAFVSGEISPTDKLRIVASLRYDMFQYKFDNHLTPSAFSGSADTSNRFAQFSPKIGFTYNFSASVGAYANYSEGFVPPQVTEMFTGVKVPDLSASVFYNYEVGGWLNLFHGKVNADFSAYQLNGTNEIVSVKMDDGSFANANAGKTSHKGIEFGITVTPVKPVVVRFSGAYSKHRFTTFNEKGVQYDGNEMNNAPNWIHNSEIWYKPSFLKGLRLGAEWQRIGRYFMDPKNSVRYDGYHVFHVRAGYKYKGAEIWLNVMNVTDNYYSYVSTKSNSGYSYQLAEPRNFNFGVAYDLATIFKTQ